MRGFYYIADNKRFFKMKKELLILLSLVQHSPFNGIEVKAKLYEHPDIANQHNPEKHFTDIHSEKIEVQIRDVCRYSKSLDIVITDAKMVSRLHHIENEDNGAVLPEIHIKYSYKSINGDTINGGTVLEFKGKRGEDVTSYWDCQVTTDCLQNFGNDFYPNKETEALEFSNKAHYPSTWYSTEIVSGETTAS